MTIPPPLGSGNCIRMNRPTTHCSTPALFMVEVFLLADETVPFELAARWVPLLRTMWSTKYGPRSWSLHGAGRAGGAGLGRNGRSLP